MLYLVILLDHYNWFMLILNSLVWTSHSPGLYFIIIRMYFTMYWHRLSVHTVSNSVNEPLCSKSTVSIFLAVWISTLNLPTQFAQIPGNEQNKYWSSLEIIFSSAPMMTPFHFCHWLACWLVTMAITCCHNYSVMWPVQVFVWMNSVLIIRSNLTQLSCCSVAYS